MLDNSDEDNGQSGQGGKSGNLGFRIKTEVLRDDLLSPSELKHLQQTHKDIHQAYVKKQKLLRQERIALKEGRKDLAAQHRSTRGLGGYGAGSSNYKKHPILANKAQFSGVDKQVSQVPTQNEAETNENMRNELQNRHTLTMRPQPTQRFNPTPKPGRL